VAAAHWALENLRSETFILDDGFQHLRIARDLNIVTIDASDAWGGRRLLPRGRLREPLSGLSRADVIVISRSDLAPDLKGLRAEALRLSGGRARVFTSRLRTSRVRPLILASSDDAFADKNSSDNNSTASKVSAFDVNSAPQPLAAFCALGNPSNFFEHLRRDAYVVNYTRAFPDHHVYTQSDLDALAREAAGCGARALVTTAKDGVKLRSLKFSLPCLVCEVEIEFDGKDKLLDLVRAAVRR
jgi:tetraacyldisaccharide 4'-kinase